MKMKMKIKNRSHGYNIKRPSSGHGNIEAATTGVL